MFTGFATENTPAIQVWDFSKSFASTSAERSVSLANDCAPIQFFKTGGALIRINVYLPTAPIDGKPITLINAKYGSSNQAIYIFTPDSSGSYAGVYTYTLGVGQTLNLCYTKDAITTATGSGYISTGWISLNILAASSNGAGGSVLSGGVASGFNMASGKNAVVAGGYSNTASDINAAVIGGYNNTSGNSNSAVVGGNNNQIYGSDSGVFGGTSNNINGSSSVAVGGTAANISSSASGTFASSNSTILAGNSVSIGGSYGGNRFIQGYVAIPACYAPVSYSAGVSQGGFLVLGAETYNASPKLLTSVNYFGSGYDFNQLSLPSGNPAAYYFKGTVVAYINTGAAKSWTFEGLMKTGSPNGFVGTPTIVSNFSSSGTSTWAVTLSFDSSSRALAVTATGDASNTVRWVCKLESTEVTY